MCLAVSFVLILSVIAMKENLLYQYMVQNTVAKNRDFLVSVNKEGFFIV